MKSTGNYQGSASISTLFYQPGRQRLRAGWRLLIQTILLVGFLGCLGIPYVLANLWNHFTGEGEMLVAEVMEFLAITLSVLLSRRFLDHETLQGLGLDLKRHPLRDFLTGLLIAVIAMSFIFLLETLPGWIEFNKTELLRRNLPVLLVSVLISILTFTLVGWNEELLSRGYHLQTIASGSNMAWGLFLSSAIFGILHIFNPGATWISTLGVFLAGLFLGLGYVRTRQLWLSLGLHVGWNFSEGVIFGFPVSGWNGFHLIHITIKGPALWTGGAFGPEAGLIVLPGLILGSLMIWFFTRKVSRVKNESH